MIRVGKAVGLTCSLLTGFALALGGCGGDSQLVPSETPLTPTDSLEPPPGNPPAPPPDTTSPPVPPPDTVTPPPPDTTGTPPYTPVHVGIAFGHYHLPAQLFSPKLSGVLRKASPETILADLEAARRSNTRVVLNLMGNERRLRDEKGHFSYAVWKARIDRYRGLDISSYIADGTILAHYMIDEPQDPSNWAGIPVPPSVIDEMAKYSKELWPGMATVVRGYRDEGVPTGYQYQYLDAAWAQYNSRYGDVSEFIRNNVRDATNAGVALVVGLNMVSGGRTNELPPFYFKGKAMTASEVRSWGSALLAEPYVCAFISWRYVEGYFARPDVLAAIEELGDQARSRPKKDCHR